MRLAPRYHENGELGQSLLSLYHSQLSLGMRGRITVPSLHWRGLHRGRAVLTPVHVEDDQGVLKTSPQILGKGPTGNLF